MKLITILLCAGIAFLIGDCSSKTQAEHTGTIVDMKFAAGQTGVGMAGSKMVVTTTDDEWDVIIRNQEGHIETIECEGDEYYGHKVGDPVRYITYHGRLTGIQWDTQLAN